MNILSDAPVHAPPPPAPASPEKPARDPPAPAPASLSHQDIKIESAPTNLERDMQSRDRRSKPERSGESTVQASAAAPPVYPVPPPQLPTTSGPPGLTVKATEEAYAAILEKADTSDLEEPGMEGMKVQWHQRSAKRAAETEAREGDKRKVTMLHCMPCVAS